MIEIINILETVLKTILESAKRGRYLIETNFGEVGYLLRFR